MRFTKKQLTISAEQFLPLQDKIPVGVVSNAPLGWIVHTLEGPLNVSDGDWIITGIQGEVYPCKPDIFASSYTPAEPVVNAVTRTSIEAKIRSTTYTVLEDTNITVCNLTLTCGFNAIGMSACVATENFDKEKGERYAKEQAIEHLWELEGYLLSHKLAGEIK